MLFFILRERRRRHRVNITFDPNLLEKSGDDRSRLTRTSQPMGQSYAESPRANPPYTSDKFLSPTTSFYPRTSGSNWSEIAPADSSRPGDRGLHPASAYGKQGGSESHMSLSSLDIEGILNLAAVQSSRSSHQDPATVGPSGVTVPQPTPQTVVTRPYPARGHLRDPSDVPMGPTSMATSNFSVNPFSDDNVVALSPNRYSPTSIPVAVSTVQYQEPVIRSPAAVMVGIPPSPRGPRRQRSTGLDGLLGPSPLRTDSSEPSANIRNQ